MYSIEALKKYIITPSDFYIKLATHDIDKNGFNHFFAFILECLDCSVVWDNGMRPHQTINSGYKNDISIVTMMLEKYIEDDVEKQEYYQLIIDLHNKNLEYEKINPPIVYSKDKKTAKRKSTKAKDTNKETPLKEKLVSSKLNKLTLNIKPHENETI